MKYRQHVLGLILVSPLCKAPSWKEWLYNKVSLLGLLNFCCGVGGVLENTYSYIKLTTISGGVKFTLLLWHVWSCKGAIAQTVFQ